MRVGVGVAVAEGEVAVAAGLWRLLQLRGAARRRMGRRLVTVRPGVAGFLGVYVVVGFAVGGARQAAVGVPVGAEEDRPESIHQDPADCDHVV